MTSPAPEPGLAHAPEASSAASGVDDRAPGVAVPEPGDGGVPIGRSGQATGLAGSAVGPAVLLPPRPRWLLTGGLRISYVDAGDGPVVVLLHGLGHSTHGWRKNLAPLVGAGYRVIAVDLPGFGYSDSPAEHSLDMFADFVCSWLDLHCVERAALVGNSMGALISAAVAARHPQRVSALVLVNAAGFSHEISWFLRLMTVGSPRLVIRRRISAWEIRRVLRLVYHDPSRIEDEEVERIIELAARPGNRESLLWIVRRTAGLRRGMRPAMGLGALPERIDVPTLVLWGRHDRLVPVSHAEKVLAVCSDAELTVFEDAGHSPMMELPDEFNERVIRFLAARVPVEG